MKEAVAAPVSGQATDSKHAATENIIKVFIILLYFDIRKLAYYTVGRKNV